MTTLSLDPTVMVLVILACLVMLSVRDWQMFAPGCGACGARRKGMHAKDCPMRDRE